MDVKTKTKGVVKVEPKQIVTVPEGLFGFEDYKKYAIIESEYKPFIWLQSVDDENLAFLMVDPFIVCGDSFYSAFKENSKYICLMNKESYGKPSTYSCMQGLWLAGLIGN